MTTLPAHAAPQGFARSFAALTGGYWSGPDKWRVRGLTFVLGVLTICQVIVPILLNLWNQRLFDALEQRSMDRFLSMVGLVVAIILFNVVLTVVHLRVKRRLQLGWREWLTQKLLASWASRGRHYHVSFLPGEHDNPDGRIADDIRIATEYAIDLTHSLSYCVLLLVSFVNILWMVSGVLTVEVAGTTLDIHGHLLYAALLYAAAGTAIALWVGRPLVDTVNRRQGYEAGFRFGLARVRENSQVIALLHGESDERRRLVELFSGVRVGWDAQTLALSHVMIFTTAYGVLSGVFPILISAPRYIAGAISLGVLMQTAQAFQQAAAALSWPVDNLARLAEWRASVERVFGLYDGLQRVEQSRLGERHIRVDRTGADASLSFSNLTIEEPDGHVVVEPFSLSIRAGERVLIGGDPAAAIRLFRAVARIWPWGRGRIGLPANSRVFFVPQRPYLPHGSLRGALSYPGEPQTVSDDVARAALERVGLAHLVPRMDDSQPWDDALAAAEQQRLGFARLLVQRPDWIFVEGATDALDGPGQAEMLRLLDEEFPHSTLMTIGSHPQLEAHHPRKLLMERTNGSVRVVEVERPTPPTR